jgi:hypothetical protein
MANARTTSPQWLNPVMERLPLAPDQAAERPALWGGEFGAAALPAFLAAWEAADRDMPWRISEWISDMKFEREVRGAPSDFEHLEQLRLFGPGGDLQLRRHQALPPLVLPRAADDDSAPQAPFAPDRWLWRFVGPQGLALPEGMMPGTEPDLPGAAQPPFVAVDYWAGKPAGRGLQRQERRVLLWGALRYTEAGGERGFSWREDRVAGVRRPLQYPGNWPKPPERAVLEYDVFLDRGNVEAVWWRGLVGSQEARA